MINKKKEKKKVDFTKSIQTVISCRSFKVFYWKASYVQVYIKRKPLPSLVQLVSRTQTRQRFCNQESFGNSCFLSCFLPLHVHWNIESDSTNDVAWLERNRGLRRTGKAGRGACRTSSNPSASCQRKVFLFFLDNANSCCVIARVLNHLYPKIRDYMYWYIVDCSQRSQLAENWSSYQQQLHFGCRYSP